MESISDMALAQQIEVNLYRLFLSGSKDFGNVAVWYMCELCILTLSKLR
jgi:hypothetical protein